VPAEVQHDAVRLLRLQRRVQLRQSQRQVVLAVDDRRVADDAGVGRRDHAVHQPLRRLRCPGQRDRRAQPDHRRADVSSRLAWTLDWLQLRHGQSVSQSARWVSTTHGRGFGPSMGWIGLGRKIVVFGGLDFVGLLLWTWFVGCIGSIRCWVGLGWVTENGPTSISGPNPLRRGRF